MTDNKIANKITKVSRSSPQNNSETITDEHDKEIPNSLVDKWLNLALLCAVDFIDYFTFEFSLEFGQIKMLGQIHNDVILGS